MKTCVLANQKGGVGKSTLTTQLAYYFRIKLGKRVLVLDFDRQGHSGAALKRGEKITVSAVKASAVFGPLQTTEDADFVLVEADDDLLKLERQEARRSEMATNLARYLKSVESHFDVCLIDTNPNPDIRLIAALSVADFALSLTELKQEAISGLGDFLTHKNTGLITIRNKVNPKLEFLGILPNKVESNEMQKQALNDLVASPGISKFLLRVDNTSKSVGFIRNSVAVAEAQAFGLPIWELPKTSARDIWRELAPLFTLIGNRILGTEKQ
jgi:chromosome partitioning protein